MKCVECRKEISVPMELQESIGAPEYLESLGWHFEDSGWHCEMERDTKCDLCGALTVCQKMEHMLPDGTTDYLYVCARCPTEESWKSART